MNMVPIEQILVQRVSHEGALSGVLSIKIPATIAEHNAMLELLKRIRRDFPGAWYCAQQWEREEYPPKKYDDDVSLTKDQKDAILAAKELSAKLVVKEGVGFAYQALQQNPVHPQIVAERLGDVPW